jgi:NTE family protein
LTHGAANAVKPAMTIDNGAKSLTLALQGGGAHAAFTWGVLERLLDEVAAGRLHIAAISGTSGGALNAAACAAGLNESPDEAKRLLATLWDAVAAESLWSPGLNVNLAAADSPSRWNVDSNPLLIALDTAQQVNSPYFTPWMQNPIGPIVEKIIPDFAALNSNDGKAPRVYVAATNINRTSLRVFGPGELSVNALLASSCYPTLFQAVEIDGEFFWDGGYIRRSPEHSYRSAGDCG